MSATVTDAHRALIRKLLNDICRPDKCGAQNCEECQVIDREQAFDFITTAIADAEQRGREAGIHEAAVILHTWPIDAGVHRAGGVPEYNEGMDWGCKFAAKAILTLLKR